jgi:hypothetical protein
MQGVSVGVPFLAVAPSRPRPEAPVVVLWHMMDPPRTAEAFSAALPLRGVDAWKIYLGLPLTGSRLPAGGMAELMRLAAGDAVMNLHEPISRTGAVELPAVLEALAAQLGWRHRPALALVGGSLGSVVAQRALLETIRPAGWSVDAAVLVSPVSQLRPMVNAMSERFNVAYQWHDASSAVADRLDFVARAPEFSALGQPAVRLIVGAEDHPGGFVEPATRLRDALMVAYDNPARVDLTLLAGMGHPLADEPGIERAPQTLHAAQADGLAAEWLCRHLRGCRM